MKKFKKENIIFLLILSILFIFILFFSEDKFSKIEYLDNIPIESKYNNIAILDKKLFILRSNTLTAYNRKGKELFSGTIPLKKGTIIANYNKAVIFEEKILYILNDKGKIKKSINVEFNITNIVIKNNNIFVVGKKDLSIYDLNGKSIGKIKTKDQIATFDISKDNKEILVTTLKLEKDIYSSSIYLKNLEDDKEIVQSFINEIIIYSEYLEDRNYLLVSNRQFMYMSGVEILNKRLAYNIKGVGTIKTNIFLLDGDKLNIYDLEFNLRNSLQLEGDYKYLYAVRKRLFLLNGNTISEYSRGEIKKVNAVDNIKRVIENNNGLYLITNDIIMKVESYIGG